MIRRRFCNFAPNAGFPLPTPALFDDACDMVDWQLRQVLSEMVLQLPSRGPWILPHK